MPGKVHPEDVDDTFYAKSMIGIYSLLQKAMTAKTAETRAGLKIAYITHLDPEALYTSGLWTDIMSIMSNLFSVDKLHYGKAISSLLDKATSQNVYEELVRNSIRHCEGLSWDDTEQMILDYYEVFAGTHGYSSKMGAFLNLARRRAGSSAPDLSNLPIQPKTILFFYSSNCENCKREMAALVEHYTFFKANGFDVISISADENKRVFDKYSEDFPWKHKLCDFKGITGQDFVTYGILETPTFYLIGDENKVVGRFFSITEIKNMTGITYGKDFPVP